jgi:hypothetical protein
MPAFEPSLKSLSRPACLNDSITPLLYRSSIQRSTGKAHRPVQPRAGCAAPSLKNPAPVPRNSNFGASGLLKTAIVPIKVTEFSALQAREER